MPFSTRCMTANDWGMVQHFRPTEFRHPHRMGREFIMWLDRVRARAGVPMDPTSDYRDPAHNASVGGAKGSAHTQVPCNAADFDPPSNEHRWKIITAAIAEGCTRIGIYKDGSIHLDRSEDTHPAPRMWVVVENPA